MVDLTKLFSQINRQTGANCVYICDEATKKYLTGYGCDFGCLLLEENKHAFFTDLRYFEEAKNSLKQCDVIVKQYSEEIILQILSGKTVAVCCDKTTCNDYRRLVGSGINTVDCSKIIENLAAVKTEFEADSIARACELAENAFISVLNKLREGVTEREVAAELEYHMKRSGAEGTSFSTIVAFGRNSAVPHHQTDTTKLIGGACVLMDFGCKVNGYSSDLTRTISFGKGNDFARFSERYNAVLQAQTLAIENISAGMTGKNADAIARDYFDRLGYGAHFTHSLGHGIGINIHEAPYLSARSSEILSDGMCFSIEPGLYFENEYGIRIEDSVSLSGGRVQSLMKKSDKKLIIL